MIFTSGPLRAQRGVTLAIALLCALAVGGAEAQVRWTVDQKASLAWFQINPHLNHLWSTTCPEEPSWRPGEGHSGGWSVSYMYTPAKHGFSGVSDTTLIPIYPRRKMRWVCAEALTAEIFVADTAAWVGVSGRVVVKANALVGGDDRRDTYTRQAVLETTRYPEIQFALDSLVSVTRQADTLRGTGVGVFTVRGVSQPMTAGIRAWPEAGGLRVIGKFHVDANDLIHVYGISKFVLGLGVATSIWKDLYMGVDLLLRPEAAGGK